MQFGPRRYICIPQRQRIPEANLDNWKMNFQQRPPFPHIRRAQPPRIIPFDQSRPIRPAMANPRPHFSFQPPPNPPQLPSTHSFYESLKTDPPKPLYFPNPHSPQEILRPPLTTRIQQPLSLPTEKLLPPKPPESVPPPAVRDTSVPIPRRGEHLIVLTDDGIVHISGGGGQTNQIRECRRSPRRRYRPKPRDEYPCPQNNRRPHHPFSWYRKSNDSNLIHEDAAIHSERLGGWVPIDQFYGVGGHFDFSPSMIEESDDSGDESDKS